MGSVLLVGLLTPQDQSFYHQLIHFWPLLGTALDLCTNDPTYSLESLFTDY